MFSSAYSAEKDHWHGILKVVNRADITSDVPGYRSVNSVLHKIPVCFDQKQQNPKHR